MNAPLPFPALQLLDYASLAKLILTSGFGAVTALFLLGIAWERIQRF